MSSIPFARKDDNDSTLSLNNGAPDAAAGLSNDAKDTEAERGNDNDEENADGAGRAFLRPRQELDQIEVKKPFSLIELTELLERHAYPTGMIYTRNEDDGVECTTFALLRYDKPIPTTETFVSLLTYTVQVQGSLFLPTRSQIDAEHDKAAKSHRRRAPENEVVAVVFAKNFCDYYSVRENLVIKNLSDDLIGTLHAMYSEANAPQAEAKAPPAEAEAPLAEAKAPPAVTTRSVVDYEPWRQEGLEDLEDLVDYDADYELGVECMRSLGHRVGEYYFRDIIELAKSASRQSKVVVCLYQKFTCVAKWVKECLSFLKSLPLEIDAGTIFDRIAHQRAMNLCSLILDSLEPVLSSSLSPTTTWMMSEKKKCYALFCSVKQDLDTLDHFLKKLPLSPDQLARAPGPVALAVGYKKLPDMDTLTHYLETRKLQIERLERRVQCVAAKMEEDDAPPSLEGKLEKAKNVLASAKCSFQEVFQKAKKLETSGFDPWLWEYCMEQLELEVDRDIVDLRKWCDGQLW